MHFNRVKLVTFGTVVLGIIVIVAGGWSIARKIQEMGSPAAGTTVEVGPVEDYREVAVYEQFKRQGFYLVHLPEGKLVALDTASTHLGCITNWLPNHSVFKNPCNGSLYDILGINRIGQDPRPLEHYRIYLHGEQIVVDKTVRFRQELGEWESPSSFTDLLVVKGNDGR